MAFNKRGAAPAKPVGSSPVQTGKVADVRTGNNAPGFSRDAKSELFLLATTSFFGQDKFYETKDASTQRFVSLVHSVTHADPAWMLDFITWLRGDGNIRTAAVVASVESAKAAKDFQVRSDTVAKLGPQDTGWGRKLAKAGIGRPDEVGEALAYFTTNYGRKIPKPIKRGLADALVTKVTEFSVLKYDSGSKQTKVAYTLADLINLLHPSPKPGWQADLFGYVVAKAYGEVEIPATLLTLATRKELMDLHPSERRTLLSHPHVAQMFKAAGMTWEALAGWLQGPMDKAAWEAIIPSMGVMAQIRNLRNFDQAGVSDQAIRPIIDRLTDPEQVRKSKQLPFRFLSAHRNAPSLRWGHALAQALDLSLTNIPKMSGRTLVLVDTSGSMADKMSEHGDVARWDIAALFGIALQKRMGTVNVVSYSGGSTWATGAQLRLKEFQEVKGAPVLAECQRWSRDGFNIGGGTPTAEALKACFMGHDRVIILTDEQADYHRYGGGVGDMIPANVPLYTFNLAGYKAGHTKGTPYRHTFGGLTDHAFTLIPIIEAGLTGVWPWENAA